MITGALSSVLTEHGRIDGSEAHHALMTLPSRPARCCPMCSRKARRVIAVRCGRAASTRLTNGVFDTIRTIEPNVTAEWTSISAGVVVLLASLSVVRRPVSPTSFTSFRPSPKAPRRLAICRSARHLSPAYLGQQVPFVGFA